MIQQTLLNLRQQQAFLNVEVAVLIAPALSKKRFEQELKWGEGAISHLWQNPIAYDFVKSQWYENWQEYESSVVLPTLLHLLNLEQNTNARVIPDITYAEFCHTMLSGRYQAVFLVAHHICKPDFDAIEFADGARLIKDIKDFFLKQIEVNRKVDLMLFVCQSLEFKNDIYITSPLIQYVASASWNIPLHEGVRFIYHWVCCIDGVNTLSEAYNKAIQKFL